MGHTDTPRVSVCMCVYNDAPFLRETIDSILAQSWRDFELIIVNDGSTDASRQIIESYDDSRIVAISRKHEGTVKSRILALNLTRGKYVAISDADDVSAPDRLLKQAEFLDAHDDVALVGTGVTLIDERGRRLREYIYPAEHAGLEEWLYEFTNPLPHSTVMYRRDAAVAVGGYDELFSKAEEAALILNLLQRYRVASIREPLVKIRYRAASWAVGDDQAEQWKVAVLARALAAIRQHTSVELRHTPTFPEFLRRYDKWFEASGAKGRFVSSKLRRMALLKWHERDYSGGLGLLARSIIQDPRWPLRRLLRKNPIWDRDVERQVLEIAKNVRAE